MRLMTSSLVLLAAVVLLAAGCERVAQVPEEQTPGSDDPYSYREDVAEVVVTAERPGWLMPEVVVAANRMDEVVVRAASARRAELLSAMPANLPVN